MALRVDPARGQIQIVMPSGLAETEAIRFAGRHLGWIHTRLAALPPALPFVDGARVPVLGLDHVIRHDPTAGRGLGHRQNGEIRVGGQVEHLARRVRDGLIAEARQCLSERATRFAQTLDVRVQRITLRDTRGRWGSCSATGHLSFSWRLILTPESVLTYVVAHEVAHLRELNHSPRFWSEVARLISDSDTPRAWLRRHGAAILRIGSSLDPKM